MAAARFSRRRVLTGAAFASVALAAPARAEWRVHEESTLDSAPRAPLRIGDIFQTRSGYLYSVKERPRDYTRKYWPGVIVLTDGRVHKLFIEGLDEPVVCLCLNCGFGRPTAPPARPTRSRIEGTFTGWDGNTIVELDNGQIWRQDEYLFRYTYAYRPEAVVFEDGGRFRMKVEGIDKAVRVRRVR